MAACALVLLLAGRRTDFQCLLEAGIKPFFILYACADCGLPLPRFFSLELFWKHLDAIISAQCWRGLGAERTAVQNSTRDGVLPIFSDFSQENEDREGIVQALLALSLRSELPKQEVPKQMPDSPPPVHELCIVITGDQWVAKCKLGRLWYDANNLADKDVAPFAMLDTLTRVLPHWRGGIVQILTSDVQLLWGVCGGPPSGAWTVVGRTCKSHHIQLRAKWAALKSYEICLPADPAKREALVPAHEEGGPRPCTRRGRRPSSLYAKREALVPVRDEDVVNTIVEELSMMKGDNAAGTGRKMICHFHGRSLRSV